MVITTRGCGSNVRRVNIQDEIANELRVKPPFRLGAYADVEEDISTNRAHPAREPLLERTPRFVASSMTSMTGSCAGTRPLQQIF